MAEQKRPRGGVLRAALLRALAPLPLSVDQFHLCERGEEPDMAQPLGRALPGQILVLAQEGRQLERSDNAGLQCSCGILRNQAPVGRSRCLLDFGLRQIRVDIAIRLRSTLQDQMLADSPHLQMPTSSRPGSRQAQRVPAGAVPADESSSRSAAGNAADRRSPTLADDAFRLKRMEMVRTQNVPAGSGPNERRRARRWRA